MDPPSSASVVIGSSCVSGSLFSLLLQNDLILANYVFKSPYFTTRSHSEIPSGHEFGGYYSQHSVPFYCLLLELR